MEHEFSDNELIHAGMCATIKKLNAHTQSTRFLLDKLFAFDASGIIMSYIFKMPDLIPTMLADALWGHEYESNCHQFIMSISIEDINSTLCCEEHYTVSINMYNTSNNTRIIKFHPAMGELFTMLVTGECESLGEDIRDTIAFEPRDAGPINMNQCVECTEELINGIVEKIMKVAISLEDQVS